MEEKKNTKKKKKHLRILEENYFYHRPDKHVLFI